MEITHIYENTLGLKCYNIEEVADPKVKTVFQGRSDEDRAKNLNRITIKK
jgi:hypothetical protein